MASIFHSGNVNAIAEGSFLTSFFYDSLAQGLTTFCLGCSCMFSISCSLLSYNWGKAVLSLQAVQKQTVVGLALLPGLYFA